MCSLTPWLQAPECVADLSVNKVDTLDPVIAGTTLTYTLSITNIGPGDAMGVVLTDTLPAAMTFVSATASQGTGCSAAGTVVTCDLGDLPNDAGAAITLTATVDPAARGVYTNTATVAGNETDHIPPNSTITEDTTVNGAPICRSSRPMHPTR